MKYLLLETMEASGASISSYWRYISHSNQRLWYTWADAPSWKRTKVRLQESSHLWFPDDMSHLSELYAQVSLSISIPTLVPLFLSSAPLHQPLVISFWPKQMSIVYWLGVPAFSNNCIYPSWKGSEEDQETQEAPFSLYCFPSRLHKRR